MEPRGRRVTVTSARRVVEAVYVVGLGALAVIAQSDPNNVRTWAWVAALVLCIPGVVLLLPVLYLAASTAWNVTGGDHGGVTWPVTATYVAVLVLAAVLNVWLVRVLVARRHARRSAVASTWQSGPPAGSA